MTWLTRWIKVFVLIKLSICIHIRNSLNEQFYVEHHNTHFQAIMISYAFISLSGRKFQFNFCEWG